MDLEVRWMKREDFDVACKIMAPAGGDVGRKRLEKLISKSTVVCAVAESSDEVVGILIYDIGRVSKIKILEFAVEQNSRRKGVGARLMSAVISSLNKKRNKIEISVSEYNLSAQIFLRSAGFRAVAVQNDPPNPSEYKFLYKFVEEEAAKEA